MTRLGDFSNETLAVDAISADIGLLEKLAARGGVLTDDDLARLARCSARLTRLLPVFFANEMPSGVGFSVADAENQPIGVAGLGSARQSKKVV